jgi:hypothetical protein
MRFHYCVFSCPCYVVKSNFEIDINNDELLKTIWEERYKRNKAQGKGGGGAKKQKKKARPM